MRAPGRRRDRCCPSSPGRPAAEASDLTVRRSAPAASEAIAAPTAVALVAALDRAWQDIRRRHEEVPPVVLLVGPSPSRPRAKRRTLGYFTSVGWSVPQSEGAGGLLAAESLLAEADEKDERYSELAVQADAILLSLAQVYREMSNTRGELFMATELVPRGAMDMFAVLLHEAAHAIASRRGIKDTSRQGRYHNGRFRMIAEEVGLEGDRDPERGWSLMAQSEEAKAGYRDTVAQLTDALAGRPGPQDCAVFAAAAGPVCGCGQWVPLTRRRRPRIVAGTVMCGLCAERSTGALRAPREVDR
jgi:hypothetical protein